VLRTSNPDLKSTMIGAHWNCEHSSYSIILNPRLVTAYSKWEESTFLTTWTPPKKHPHSPGDDLLQWHSKTSTQAQAPHQYWAVKDKCLRGLERLEKKQHHPILRNTETQWTTARSSKCTTGIGHGHAAVVTTGPQHPPQQSSSTPPLW